MIFLRVLLYIYVLLFSIEGIVILVVSLIAHVTTLLKNFKKNTQYQYHSQKYLKIKKKRLTASAFEACGRCVHFIRLS